MPLIDRDRVVQMLLKRAAENTGWAAMGYKVASEAVAVMEVEEGEHCQVCGRAYSDVYSLPDKLWEKITPKLAPAGLLCPTCALSRLANVVIGDGATKD